MFGIGSLRHELYWLGGNRCPLSKYKFLKERCRSEGAFKFPGCLFGITTWSRMRCWRSRLEAWPLSVERFLARMVRLGV
jgi:hypothetical protein